VWLSLAGRAGVSSPGLRSPVFEDTFQAEPLAQHYMPFVVPKVAVELKRDEKGEKREEWTLEKTASDLPSLSLMPQMHSNCTNV
jgi:hypothetical protein